MDELQLALWGRPAELRRRRRGPAPVADPGLTAATEVLSAALVWAEAVLEGADVYRSRIHDEVDAEAVAWLDEADLERVRILEEARAEAERLVAAGESARRRLITEGRDEAERRVDAADKLAVEFLAEADLERDAILARAENAAAAILAEADAALDRSLEEGDRERTRLITSAREEVVALRAEADQALQAEATQILDRVRLEADTIRAEAERQALLVRAEATAAFAKYVEEVASAQSQPDDAPVVQGFIGSGGRLTTSADDDPTDRKPRRRLARLLRAR